MNNVIIMGMDARKITKNLLKISILLLLILFAFSCDIEDNTDSGFKTITYLNTNPDGSVIDDSNVIQRVSVKSTDFLTINYPTSKWSLNQGTSFIGWTLENEDEKHIVLDENKVDTPWWVKEGGRIKGIKEDTNLYAVYTKNKPIVLTMLPDGTETGWETSEQVLPKLYYQRTGTSSGKWFKNEECTIEVENGYTVPKPIKQWEVHFNLDGGRYKYKEGTTLPTDDKLTAKFNFEGIKSDTGMQFVTSDGVIDLNTYITKDTNATVYWSQSDGVVLPDAEKDDHVFAGWWLNNQRITSTSYFPPSNNITLSAHFTETTNSYIKYVNSANDTQEEIENIPWDGNSESYDTSVKTYPDSWIIPNAKKFVGWTTDLDKAKSGDGQPEYLSGIEIRLRINDNWPLILYAMYKDARRFTISLDNNGATTLPMYDNKELKQLYYQAEGNIGWYVDEALTTKLPDNASITKPEKSWSVKINYQNGESEQTQKTTFTFDGYRTDAGITLINRNGIIQTNEKLTIEAPARAKFIDQTKIDLSTPPVRNGYAFIGWTLNGKEIKTQTYEPAMDNTTLIATWIKDARIIYHINVQGESKTLEDKVSGINRSLTIKQYPAEWTLPNGKTFIGWNTNINATVADEKYREGSSFSMAETDINLYAVYGTSTVYTLTLNHNGATTNPLRDTNTPISTLYYQSTGNIGWYYDKAATIKVQSNARITNPKKEWEVIFDYNGGTIQGTTTPATTVKQISSFDFQGYGEYIQVNGLIDTSAIITKDETVYASWANQSSISIPRSNTFSKTGSTFNGWKDDSGLTYTGSYLPTSPSITLTANWIDDITITYINSFDKTQKDTITISGLNRTITINSFDGEWKVPAKSEFSNWSDGEGGGSSYKDYRVGEPIELSGSLTLYSVFKESEVYTLTFEHSTDETKKPTLDGKELNIIYYQATGHKDAIGWYKDSACQEKITSAIITKPEKIWTLSFNANGGQTISKQGKSEFTFDGYSVYVDKDGNINTAREIHSNTKVSATWINQTSIDVNLTATREGYAFRYWKTKNSNGDYVRVRASSYIPSQNNTEFVAEWIKDSKLTYINTVNKSQSITRTISGEDRNITIEKIDTSWNWTASSGEFLGWSSNEVSSSSDSAYNVGKRIQLNGDGESSTDLTLYAVYGKTDVYELSFDNSDATTKARISVNNSIRDLTSLYYSVREGSKNAWYYDENLKNEIPANARLSTIPKKIYTVSFNYNGGKGSVSKSNYEFTYNGFGPYIDKNGYINIDDGIDTDINVSVMWTEGQSRIDLPTPTKNNAVFDKWVYTDDDGEDVIAINPFVPNKDQMELKALWFETTSITYKNPFVDSETITNIKEGNDKSEVILSEYPAGWSLQPKKKFIGWSLSNTATIPDPEYSNGKTIKVDSDITLYAVYGDVNIYSITFVPDSSATDAYKTIDGTVLTAIYYQPEGNVGWYYTDACEGSDAISDMATIIIPKKERIVYLDVANGDPLPVTTLKSTFEFQGYGNLSDESQMYIDANGNFLLSSKSIMSNLSVYPNWANQTYVELPTPTRSGYVFNDWFVNDTNIGNRFLPTEKETTVRALWWQNYEIKYVNLPESLNETITTIVYGSKNRMATILTYPENWTLGNKKEFLGWSEDKTAISSQGKYSPGSTIENISASITLYPVYADTKVFTLTFDNNGATTEPHLGTDTTISNLYYQVSGHKGWYYDEACTMKVASDANILVPEKVWKVTFDVDGGKPLESDFANSIFEFAGYTYGGKTYISSEGRLSLINIAIASNITIKANWINQSAVTLPSPEKENNTFKEWAIDGEGLGSAKTYTPKNGDETLVAQWIKNTTITYVRLASEQTIKVYEFNGIDKNHRVLGFFDDWALPNKLIFKGWSTDVSASDADANYAVGNDISVDDDIILYAIYETAKVYVLTINHMGATQLTTRSDGSKRLEVKALYYQAEGNIGWYYDSDCSLPIQRGDKLNLPTKVFAVTFDPNGGTVTSNTANSRFTFASFKYVTSGGEVTRRPVIDIDGTINIDQKISTDTAMYVEWTDQSSVLLPDVNKADRTPFVTWSVNDTWLDEGLTEYYPKDNNEVLKAVWFENVSITYQNSEVDSEKQQISVKERNVSLIDLPDSWKIPDGKVFVAWSMYASPQPEDKSYEAGETVKLSRSVQFYPIYQEAKYYTLSITYDKDVDVPIKRTETTDPDNADVKELYYHVVGKNGWYFDKSKRLRFYDGKQISIPKKYYSVTQKDGTDETIAEDNFAFGGIKIEAKVGNYTTLLEFISKDGSVNTSCSIDKNTSVDLVWGEQEGITLASIKYRPESDPNAVMGWYTTGDSTKIVGLAGDKFYADAKTTTIEAKEIDVVIIVDPNNENNKMNFTYDPASTTLSDRTHIFNPKNLKWNAPSGQVIKGFANGTDPNASGYVMYDTSKTYEFEQGKSESLVLYCVYGTPTVYKLTYDYAYPTSEAISQITNKRVTDLYYVADKWYEAWYYDFELNRKVEDGQKFVAPRKTVQISFENTSNYSLSLEYTPIIDETEGVPFIKKGGTEISLRDTDKISKDTIVVMNTWVINEKDKITIPSYSWRDSSGTTIYAYIWTVNLTSARLNVFQPGEILDMPFNELIKDTLVFKPYLSTYSVVKISQAGYASVLNLAIPHRSIYKKYGGTYELPKKGLKGYIPEAWNNADRGVYCDGFVIQSSKKFVLSSDDVEVFGDASYLPADKALQVHQVSNGVKYVYASIGSASGYIVQKDENYQGDFDTVTIFGTWRDESGEGGYSVLKIDDNVFSGNANLKTVSISGKIRNIGNNAFADCVNLESIEIFESGVNDAFTLGSGAFKNCSKLEYVVIGGSSVTLGKGAFEGCVGLTRIVLPGVVTPTITDEATLFANSGSNSVSMLLKNGQIRVYKKSGGYDTIYGISLSGNMEFTGNVDTPFDVNVVLTANTANGVRFSESIPSGTDPTTWFSYSMGESKIPTGLTCTAVRVNASTLNINIKGTPTATQATTNVHITLPKEFFNYEDPLFNKDEYKTSIECPQNFKITVKAKETT